MILMSLLNIATPYVKGGDWESGHGCVCVYVCVCCQMITWTEMRHVRPPAPMNHVKYLKAGPAEMPFQNWYTANTNHFHLTDSVRWKSKTQLG